MSVLMWHRHSRRFDFWVVCRLVMELFGAGLDGYLSYLLKEKAMEHTGILTGVIFGLLIFAFKAGIGIAYRISTADKIVKKYIIIGSSMAYLILFVGVSYLVQRMDVTVYLGKLLPMLRTGTTIHIILCVLMAIWGVYLLSKQNSGHKAIEGYVANGIRSSIHGDGVRALGFPSRKAASTRAWLMLAVPCPVCMTVILFSLAFLQALLPDRTILITSGLYLAFMMTVFLTAYGFYRIKDPQNSPETLLAYLMLGVSGYFMLLLVISPQIQGITEVYELVARRNVSNPMADNVAPISLNFINMLGMLTMLASAVVGFFWQLKKMKKAVMK